MQQTADTAGELHRGTKTADLFDDTFDDGARLEPELIKCNLVRQRIRQLIERDLKLGQGQGEVALGPIRGRVQSGSS